MVKTVHRLLKLGLALVSVTVLLAQGAIAGVSAVACMKACEEAKAPQATGGSCHSQETEQPKGDCKKGGGACTYICSADKSIATPAQATTFKVSQLDVPFVTLTLLENEIDPVSSGPELFETDSSPPGKPIVSARETRAPPIFGA
jgi:hypothetical protein